MESEDDIDMLLSMLAEDQTEQKNEVTKPPSEEIKDEKKGKRKSSVNSDYVDPLELELQEMEKKMNKLKEELCKKKNISKSAEKPNFTKYIPIVEKPKESVRVLSINEKNKLLENVKRNKSAVHAGDTDSEDEEDNMNPMEAQFTSHGRDMRKRLARADDNKIISQRKDISKPYNTEQDGWKNANGGSLLPMGTKFGKQEEEKDKGVVDPFSGIKIINPLISASTMRDLMDGKRMVKISSVKSHLRGGEIEGDWVTIGILVVKSDSKTSQKGSQYSIWTLTDLIDCTIVISLFLFGEAYKKLWKTSVGTVVGVLNPQIMKERTDERRNALTISVNSNQNVLIMGVSKDLGWCKGRTQAQGHCRNFINKNICEFCIFHIQKEYKKHAAGRAAIQSSFSRVDPKKMLQNKVLGKNQVFYGGQLYGGSQPQPKIGNPNNLVKSKMNPANRSKDLARLSSLGIIAKANDLKTKERKERVIPKHMTKEDMDALLEIAEENEELGDRLLAPTPGSRNLLKFKKKEPEEKMTDIEKELKMRTAADLLNDTRRERKFAKKVSKLVPKLGRGLEPGSCIDLDSSSPMSLAKMKAASLLKAKGGIEKKGKNMVRNKDKSSTGEFQTKIKKRLLEESEEVDNSKETKIARMETDVLSKKKSLLGSVDLNSDKFKSMMEAKSKHTNLIQIEEDEQVEKYYMGLEKKEMMENKMIATMEIPTTAVICYKCNYKASSAADICLKENHPMKSVKATRRFFECRNCKRRATTLEKLPTKPCSNCDQSSWKRVGMAKEKLGPKLESEILSLRGDEQKHYSGMSSKSYLHI